MDKRLVVLIARGVDERKLQILKEKHERHEKILIQAYKSIKQKEERLKLLNEELRSSKEELNQTLENLKQTQEQLLQSEKMASLGTLTAGVAHEINNPLNFILGSYYGLQDYFTDRNIQDDDIDLLLGHIKTGVDRISAIVEGLNQFSRNNNNKKGKCSIDKIVDNCILMANIQTQTHILIEKKIKTSDLQISCSSGQLHQVFTNIITNSIHSIVDEGKIIVTVEQENNDAVVEILDNGCGICEEFLPKIFDPFFTTKPPGKGTGLGLSIVHSIVKEHKGDIKIQSKEHNGTCVRISFPIIQSQLG